MMKKKRFAALSLAGLLSLSLLVGCGPSSSTTTTEKSQASGASGATTNSGGENISLTFSHFMVEEERKNNGENDTQLSQIEDFDAANPNITIEQQAIMHDDYQTKIQAQAAVNELPDIFLVKGSWFSNFVDNGLVKPLDEFIDAYPQKDSFRDGIFDASTRDGKIYGLPIQFAVTSLAFYNESLWKENGYDSFPDNWEDIYTAAATFNEKGISTIALGNKDKWPAESCWLSPLGDRYTGTDWTNSIISQDGKAKFTDPLFVDALTHFQTMAEKGVFNSDFNIITNTQADEYYAQGEAATIVSGSWTLSYILANGTDEVLANTKIAVIPGVPDGKGNPADTSGGCGWYVCANSNLSGEKLQAAVDAMLSISGYEYSKRLAENYGLVGPCKTGKIDASGFPQLTQDYLALMDKTNLTPIYDILMEGAVIETMNSGLQELLNKTQTPEDLAATIQAEQDKVKKN